MKLLTIIKILTIFIFINVLITYTMISTTITESEEIRKKALRYVEDNCDPVTLIKYNIDFVEYDNETELEFPFN